MPKKVKLEDGTEIEVPTDEELKAQQDANEKLAQLEKATEEFSTLKTELGIGDDENVIDKIKELKDSQNPNWPKMREQLKAAKAKLKESGFDVDDNGKVVEEGAKVDVEEIKKAAIDAGKQSVQEALANQQKEKLFGQFTDTEERSSVETVFDKLMSLGGSAEENYELAVGKVFPERKDAIISEAFNGGEGNGPRIKDQKEGEGFAETERGKEVASLMGLDTTEANKSKE